MCKIVSGRLLNNTGSPAWCSMMTYRGGVEGGEGGPGTKGDMYVCVCIYIYIIMTDSHCRMAETNTKL